ncbi:MAG: hypothetical protein DCF22_16000 [Leptolyngbya sp.]|nr:MAG: hypothetical protein DCF22_16000 [Leptolyngbya sp.]
MSDWNLSDWNLSGWNLSGWDLSGWNLSGWDLSGWDLSSWNFCGRIYAEKRGSIRVAFGQNGWGRLGRQAVFNLRHILIRNV